MKQICSQKYYHLFFILLFKYIVILREYLQILISIFCILQDTKGNKRAFNFHITPDSVFLAIQYKKLRLNCNYI